MDQEDRYFEAIIRSGSGPTVPVQVRDISIAGCLVNKPGTLLRPDDPIRIKLADLSYMSGSVIWVEGDQAGIAFDQLLYEPVLDHLQRAFVALPQ